MRRFMLCLILVGVPALCFAYLAIPRVGGLNTTNPAEGLPTAIYANPAAMGLIKIDEFFFDLTPTYFLASFKRAGEDPDADGPHEEAGFGSLIPIPFLGAVFNPLDWLRAGAAFYVPFGRVTDWPQDGPQRYQLTKLEIMDLVFSAAVSFRVSPSLWIGGAVEPRYEIFESQRSIDFADFVPAMAEEMLGVKVPEDIIPPLQPEWEGRLSLESSGFAIGWSCGILVIPIHWINLGLTYHAPVNAKTEGDFELSVPDKPLSLFGIMYFPGGVQQMLEDLAEVEAPAVLRGTGEFKYNLPQSIVFGLSVGPVKKWRLLAQAAWIDWSVYKNIEAKLDPDNSELELPEDRIATKNVPAWLFGVVVTREHLQKNLIGFGVNYETDSIPTEYAAVYNVNSTKLDFMGFYRWQLWPKTALGFGASYVYWAEKESKSSKIDRAGAAEGVYNVNVFRLGINVDMAF